VDLVANAEAVVCQEIETILRELTLAQTADEVRLRVLVEVVPQVDQVGILRQLDQ